VPGALLLFATNVVAILASGIVVMALYRAGRIPGQAAGPAFRRPVAVILLGTALGAILLARRVFRQAGPWCAEWARHLAGAAVAIAALGAVLNAAALIAALLPLAAHGGPGHG
jgi:hypothetical protein